MAIAVKDFLVPPGKTIHLKDWPTKTQPVCSSERDYKDVLQKHVERLSDLQAKLYASGEAALLLIFQGMDTSGKDGAIRHVMSGVNPQGCSIYSFKQLSAEEQKHDFLWRACIHLPARGMIGIFNRSYYEEAVVVRVHPKLLQQELPGAKAEQEKFWQHRFDSINHFETHLRRNATHIVKFFLHVSQKEQCSRLLDRIEDPDKNWKFNFGDVHEREYWKDYRHAYEACISATSTKHAPWHIVPADDKENARLIVSQIVLDAMESLNLSYPKPDKKRKDELKEVAAKLAGNKE